MHNLEKKMFVYFLSCLSIILLFSPQTMADTNVGGIINTNTTWTLANSPYTLTNNMQIAYGAALSIEPGVVVNGNDYSIQVWGSLNAIGTNISKIKFNNTIIAPGYSGDYAKHYLINIQYSVILGGSVHPLTTAYGSLNLLDSLIQNTDDPIFLWYPVADCFIERNIFINAGGIGIGTGDYPNYDRKVYIRNNVFYKQYKCFYSDLCAVANWASYADSETIVEFNSFLNIDRVALLLPSGYSGTMIAINNYWNTTDTNIINNMIYDKNDDLSCADYINYLPILDSPHPDTPVLEFNLTLNKSGTGSGIVTSSTVGIDCGSDCIETYSPDTIVTLEAFSGTNSTFNGWSGCDLTYGNTCTVTMNDDKNITADFSQNCDRILTININPIGSGTVNKNPDKNNYCPDEQVTLTAISNTGYNFSSWSGVNSSNGVTAQVTMSSNKTVTANFTQIPVVNYTLSITKVGNGSVKVNGTTHTLPWSGEFSSGTNVQIEAISDSGWGFTNWTGDYTGSTNPTTINISGNKNITANFSQNCDYNLTVNINPSGYGTVTKNPDKANYCPNEQVTLTASPNSGYTFSLWDGVDSNSETTASITMNANRTVTANFSQQTSNEPDISANPLAEEFGNIPIGNSSMPQTLTISNTGSGNLIIGTLSITGNDASQFIKQNDTCSGQTLTPSANCTVNVIFSPTATGSFDAIFNIPSNDLDEPNVTVNLKGGSGADITGNWLLFNHSCKNTKKGIKCNIKSKLNIQNIGTKDAISSIVRFYLSDNDNFDGGDIFLKQIATGKLKSGKSVKKSFMYNFKIGISATGKYVVAVIDADNKVTEANEGDNNIIYGPLP